MEKEIKMQRIDKWLWCVRLFKTRSMATEACNKGWITIQGNAVKPSRMVKAGETVEVKIPPIVKIIFIKQMPANRVAAKLLPDLIEDKTPAEEYNKKNMLDRQIFGKRSKGTGRPTKRERRDIDNFLLNI